MKTVKFMEPDINAIMAKVLGGTSYAELGDGKSLIAAAPGMGGTFRVAYEAIRHAKTHGNTLIVVDQESANEMQTRLSLVMDYMGIDKSIRNDLCIDIHCPEVNGSIGHVSSLNLIAKSTNIGEYKCIFIDMVSTSTPILSKPTINAIEAIAIKTNLCLCKYTQIDAYINGDL